MTVTRRGLGMLAAAIVLVVTGFRFGYPDLAVLGVSAALTAASAATFAAWRPRLDVTRAVTPDRVARGEPAHGTLVVRNASRFLTVNLLAADRCGNQTVAVPLLRLRPGRSTTVHYPVPTGRRGVVALGPLLVGRVDPLALVSVSGSHGERSRVWVYPRVHPLGAMPAGVGRSLDGQLDRVPHGTITFDSLRGYVIGDDLRRVHWRSSAKVGELMVREHLDTSEPSIAVLLDDRRIAHPQVSGGTAETFEAACEAAASVLAAAARAELPATLHLVCDVAHGGFLDVLTEARLRDGDNAQLTTALRRLRRQHSADTLVFLTGPGGRAGLGAVSDLRATYPVMVAGLFGGADAPPVSPGGNLTVIEAHDGREFAAAWDGCRRW